MFLLGAVVHPPDPRLDFVWVVELGGRQSPHPGCQLVLVSLEVITSIGFPISTVT